MRLKKVIDADDAVAVIRDGDVVASTGYGGNGTPDELFVALERRFLATGSPRGLTLVFAGGQGDGAERGLNHLAHEGLLRRVIGGHFGLMPKLEQLIAAGRIEAYNFPEGVITHLYRDIAAGRPGTLTRVGLGTFVDPRQEGGRMNAATVEPLVRLVAVDGQDYLFFRSLPINVALIRGTTADPDGNVTMERETLTLENLALAIAARNSRGVTLCQVERIGIEGSLDARRVEVPGILVDAVVQAQPGNHMHTYGTAYNPAFSGEVRVPLATLAPLPLDDRKVIARRAALELAPNTVINLGIGMPDSVGRVAGEEGVSDLLTLTVDPGVIGGVPMGGLDFGAAVNYQAVIDHASEFDFIDGGGIDIAYLGFGECDARGNVNASRFGDRRPGCGGFINIAQHSRKVVFVGNFLAGGLRTDVKDGRLAILQEGRHRKFVERVLQVTFNGELAAAEGRAVLFVTERCVFRLGPRGIVLTELAPGVELERDVLAHLPFAPPIEGPRLMDPALFGPAPLKLRERLLDVRIDDRLTYDEATNTVYMNYAGMRVRSSADVERIVASVDRLLGPLAHRVNAIVNYDGFRVDDDAMPAYMDAVKYVSERYYVNVTRYAHSGLMRHLLGTELARRALDAQVYETEDEAQRRLGTAD